MNIRKLFSVAVQNWPAKVLSLGLALILFVFHRMVTLETRFFSAPLNIEHLSSMVPSSPYPRMIRVSLRGEANSIYSILDDDIEVYVDMGAYDTPGRYVVPVQWRKKGTTEGVEPLQISVDPMELTFSLDQKISKFVPVVASFRGQIDAGYNMVSYTLNPSQVIIDGPAELMRGISEVFTDGIDLDGRNGNFNTATAIMHSNPLIVIRGNAMTEFFGVINQVIPVRNISNVPIVVTGLGEGFLGELEVKACSMHLEGDNPNAVEQFEPPPDFLRVDCSGIDEPGIYFLKVIAGSAENLKFRIDPMEVMIEISDAEDLERFPAEDVP
jgi:hypothetical protein